MKEYICDGIPQSEWLKKSLTGSRLGTNFARQRGIAIGAKSSFLAACLSRTATSISARCRLSKDKEDERPVTLISICADYSRTDRAHASTNIISSFAYCSPKVRESEEGRRWTCVRRQTGRES